MRRARCRQGWPANSGVCGEDTATASLDGSCARRIRAFAGRDEETAPGRTKKRAKERKEGRASHGTVTRTLDRRVRDEEFAAELAARRLVNLVNIEGATDNATVVVVRAT